MATSSVSEDDDGAARWAIRLDRDQLSAEEQKALESWLSVDERRAGALLRAEATLAYLDRGRALAGCPSTDCGDDDRVRIDRRKFLFGGAASGLAAAGVLGFILSGSPPAEINGSPPVEINTAVGEMRRVTLADGSVASVNTDSKVAVALQTTKRAIKLSDGEAWFAVAHDRSRPFVVEAGDVRVQAVGTAFSVRLRAGGADVLVTDGAVEAWVVGRETDRTRIAAGSKAFIAAEAPVIKVSKASEEIERQLAWRTGELVLNGESLAYAVSEFNRYHKRKLVIEDAQLGREPLVGYFRTDQPVQFGRAAAKLLGAKVTIGPDAIILKRQSNVTS